MSTATGASTSVDERYQAFAGREVLPARRSPDPVNPAMIRHWCTALGDANPRYRPGPDQVAPPAMLQAWVLPGLGEPAAAAGPDGPSALDDLLEALEAGGYGAVVATDCEQVYGRDLRPDDVLTEHRSIESVSAEKQTALGVGRFVTVRSTFVDDDGRDVATMRFRTLRYRPGSGARATGTAGLVDDGAARARRPQPGLTDDNRFFFEGARRGELLVQRCDGCEGLIHPPSPHCPTCGSFHQTPSPMSGRAVVHTFIVNHHPQVAAFDYPLVVAVVELEEGVRLVTDLIGVEPADVHIGMEVEVAFTEVDDLLTLPLFTPRSRG